MRMVLIGGVIGLFFAVSSARAQDSNSQLVAQLRDAEPWVRAAAFEKLNRHPEVFATKGMAPVLLALVKRENRVVYGTLEQSNGQEAVSEKYGEGYGEYASAVTETCLHYCDLNNPDAVRSLALGPFAGGSRIGQELAAHHAALILPIALHDARAGLFGRQIEGIHALAQIARLETSLTSAQRYQVDSALLASMASRGQIVSSIAASAVSEMFAAGAHLDQSRRAVYHRAFVNAAGSRFTDARVAAVTGLAQFNDINDRPLLTELAAHDTAHTMSYGRLQFPVRIAATKALSGMPRP